MIKDRRVDLIQRLMYKKTSFRFVLHHENFAIYEGSDLQSEAQKTTVTALQSSNLVKILDVRLAILSTITSLLSCDIGCATLGHLCCQSCSHLGGQGHVTGARTD